MSGMEKLSDLLEMAKVSDIIATKKEKEDNKIVWAIIWMILMKTLMMILTMISSMKKMIRM